MTGLLPFFADATAVAAPMPVRADAEPPVEAAAFGAALQQALQSAQPTPPADPSAAPLSMLTLLDRLGEELVDAEALAGAASGAQPVAPEEPVLQPAAGDLPTASTATAVTTDGPVLQPDGETDADAGLPSDEARAEDRPELEIAVPTAPTLDVPMTPPSLLPVVVPAPVLTGATDAPNAAVPTTDTIIQKTLPNGREPRGAEVSAERRSDVAAVRARQHLAARELDHDAAPAMPTVDDPAAAAPAGDAPVLQAGVRVLELQVQPNRRPVTTRPAATPVETSAAGELNAGRAMPAAAAEAIEQLRRPVAAAGPRAPREAMPEPAQPMPIAAPVLQAAESGLGDGNARRDGTFGGGASSAEPTLRERAAQQQTPALPAELLRVPAPVLTAEPSGAEPIAAPAPVLEPQAAPALGTERISVRLGSEEGAPVVRISIRGDQVNAKISTSDASLARELGSGVRELAAALESRGFESARVSVRGTASAQELGGPAAIAASSTIGESRSSSDAKNDDQQRRPDEQGRQQREERYDAREQQRRRPRVVRYDDDHEG